MTLIDEIAATLGGMPEEQQKAVVADAMAATAAFPWVPNPGPQTQAFFCEADELFFGGQAGGGKSDLLIGIAITDQMDSLILRRVNDDAKDLAKRAREIAGDGARYNGQDKILSLGDRTVRFGGCQYEEDKERWKGRAKDFYGFDEIGDFTRSQYKFITIWNRSAKEGQRSRVVCAGNPPTRPEGLWVLQYWGAWLDPKHPKPARFGELRWYTSGANGEDVEVDGRGPHVIDGETVYARSRTFIPSQLSDNPDLVRTNYRASLDALPAELRTAYRDGNFHAELRDDDYQLIPTAWIKAAMDRWRPDGFKDFGMTAMAVDAAGGGADAAEIIWRHGGWYAPPVTVRGADTADGSYMAGRVVGLRRDGCPVVVDSGGGYGGSYALRLKDNGISVVAYKGAEGSTARTQDAAKLRFVNKRAESWWRFREALNPDQQGGAVVALPPDDELKADLAAPHWELTQRGIQIEDKDSIKKRIGRSPGKGDAAVMCLADGNAAVKRFMTDSIMPKVVVGHAAMKRRR